MRDILYSREIYFGAHHCHLLLGNSLLNMLNDVNNSSLLVKTVHDLCCQEGRSLSLLCDMCGVCVCVCVYDFGSWKPSLLFQLAINAAERGKRVVYAHHTPMEKVPAMQVSGQPSRDILRRVKFL